MTRAELRRASREFESALSAHKRDLGYLQGEHARRLRGDLARNKQLGLPANLPRSTVAILSQTQALSTLGPKRPKRSDFYKE